MDYLDLADLGFTLLEAGWSPIEELPTWEQAARTLPNSPGVYAFLEVEPFPRRWGESDILYIGSATSMRVRFKLYLDASNPRYQGTNMRVMDWVLASDRGLFMWVQTSTAQAARVLERQLLERHERDHGELPPLNRRLG